MSSRRNRYTSAPMYGMKGNKNQRSDYSGSGNPSRPSDDEQGSNSFRWLVGVILFVLPILFILSFVLPAPYANPVKIAFLVTALLTLLIMCIGRAFTKTGTLEFP